MDPRIEELLPFYALDALPDEERELVEAYLVELRSIGGLSGSPVFVHLGGSRSHRLRHIGGMTLPAADEFFLIGLMHGHWDYPLEGDAPLSTDGAFDSEKLNMGIGVVVPATKIIDLLNRPDLAQSREKMAKEEASANLPTPD